MEAEAIAVFWCSAAIWWLGIIMARYLPDIRDALKRIADALERKP